MSTFDCGISYKKIAAYNFSLTCAALGNAGMFDGALLYGILEGSLQHFLFRVHRGSEELRTITPHNNPRNPCCEPTLRNPKPKTP